MSVLYYRMPTSLLLLALFIPVLLINPNLSLNFDEVYLWPKLFWIYFVTLPTTVLVIWYGKHILYMPRTKALLLLLSIWGTLLAVSTLPNSAGWTGWWGTVDRADGVLMHLLYTIILIAGLIWALVQQNSQGLFERAALLCGTLLALTNILQQIGLMGTPGEGAVSGISATLFGGTLGNRGYMGGALALLLPIVANFVQRSHAWLWNWSAVILMSWAWAGSFTRGAWLAGVMGLIWLALWRRNQMPWRAWCAIALGILLCVATAKIRGEGRGFTTQAITDSSGRGVLWKSALYGVQERPVLGWGTPALWKAMNARTERELLDEFGTRDMAQIQRLNTRDDQAPSFLVTHSGGQREKVVLGINKVHNEYLDYALTYGIPAALMFTFLLGWAIWSGRTFAPGVSAGLVAYAAYLMTWPEIIRFAPIAWFMMGIALAGHVMQRSEVQA